MLLGKPSTLAILAVLTGIFGSMPLVSVAMAQVSGKLSAVSYLPIEAADAFEVRALDNSESNLELVKQMEQELRIRGRGVKDGARLVMTIEPRDEIGSGISSQRHVMSFTGQSSTGHEDNTELRFNVFDSQRGGILNEGDQPGSAITRSEYYLLVRIEDRTNGRQLWEGWASAPLIYGDRGTLLTSMIPHLAETVGETVSEQPIVIQ